MSRTRTVGGSITKTSNGITTIEVRGGDFIATAGMRITGTVKVAECPIILMSRHTLMIRFLMKKR
jgi:hypothetical protein